MITVTSKGSFKKTEAFLKGLDKLNYDRILHKYGRIGVAALSAATPVDTGASASSWDYRVKLSKNETKIEFYNTHMVNGTPVVIFIQHGHSTRNGGYVPGKDFINPAIQGILDQLANEIWNEVNRL